MLWHTQMSLDGFIAGPADDMRWAFEAEDGPDEIIDEVVRSTGALLVGRRAQDVEDQDQPGFYGGEYRGPFFVLRHDPPDEPPIVKGITGRYLDVDIDEAVAIAQRSAGDGHVGIVGADVARHDHRARDRARTPARAPPVAYLLVIYGDPGAWDTMSEDQRGQVLHLHASLVAELRWWVGTAHRVAGCGTIHTRADAVGAVG